MEPLTSAWVQSDVEYSPFPDPYLSAGIFLLLDDLALLRRSASWSVSDSSRYIRSRAQYAAKWCVIVKVEPPKGPEGLTRHYEVSSSQYMAAETGGWRRAASCSVKHLARKMWASVRMTPSLK